MMYRMALLMYMLVQWHRFAYCFYIFVIMAVFCIDLQLQVFYLLI